MELHSFKPINTASIKYCDFCQKPIWGLARQNYKCKKCHYTVHLACKDNAEKMRDCKEHKKVSIQHREIISEHDCCWNNSGDKAYIIVYNDGICKLSSSSSYFSYYYYC